MNNSASPSNGSDRLKIAIKEEQLTVAPETRATLTVGIGNNNPYEDDFDLIVRGVPQEWVNMPSPVVHLPSGEAKLVTFSVRPASAPDQRVAQYQVEVRAVSRKNPDHFATARSVLTVAAYQSQGRIGVMLGSVHFSASPGSILDIPILLQNRGEEKDTFRLQVRGLPESWVYTNSTLTTLAPNETLEIQLTLRVPRSPQAAAGRNPFTLQVASQLFPTQTADVDCILTIGSFLQFSSSLEPSSLQAGQFGQILVDNEGNTADTYSVYFQSPENQLVFEKAVQVARPGPQPGTQQIETGFVEIPQGDRLSVRAGERGTYSFRSRLRSRPILGGEQPYPFTASVRSTSNEAADLTGQVIEKAWIPYWVIGAAVAGMLFLCVLILLPLWNLQNNAAATQTAIVNQTQAALSGGQDTDGDGLTNDREAALGTDPQKADTDGDKLTDGDEVNTRLTNPLVADSDGDGLGDGDEVLTYQTDPRNPDTDADGLSDGLEITKGTDPHNPDTDGDGLRDGDEVNLGTDPRNPDSDGDGLKDGQENANCPRPLVPDSDNDGIVDGKDLDPCNPANPSLTGTAAAATAGAPTATPTVTPTATATPTQINTPTVTLTPAPALPSLQGIMVFSSDRDGNSEIYALNLANLAAARLTANSAQDVQPALAPDNVRVAYVTNQDGNNEIYLTGVNGGVPTNLSKNAADDQQPTWSPDGNWIAFMSNRDGNQEIYVMHPDGTGLHNLTNNAANDFAPTWYSVGGLLGSQDWIAFTSTRDGNQEIYKVKPDGSGLTNLTQNPANDSAPAGFPGGNILAFVSDRTGNADIYLMTDTGGSQTDITNNPAQDLDPAFNSNGSWIAFSTNRDGNQEIYIVAPSGGANFNLTRNQSQDFYPDW